MSHKSKQPTTIPLSSDDLIGNTLAALDAIIADAQQQEKQQKQNNNNNNSNQTGNKRKRDNIIINNNNNNVGGVFAAMAEPHFHMLQTIIKTYGVQLLPALEAIIRRVLLAISFPALSSNICWELAGLLGTYFKAGALRLLEELMELLLNDLNPFLLGATCFNGLIEEEEEEVNNNNNNNNNEVSKKRKKNNNNNNKGSSEDNAAITKETKLLLSFSKKTLYISRNLRAFEELLLAVGPFLNTSVMQKAALRFSQEIISSGILDASPSLFNNGNSKHMTIPNSSNITNNNNNNNNNNIPTFTVNVTLQPICIDILTNFLLLSRPIPSIVSATAVRIIKELPARAITSTTTTTTGIILNSTKQNINSLNYYQNQKQEENQQYILRAVNRLSVTLTALRHPHALPFYLPPQDIVEKATRRIVIIEDEKENKNKEEENIENNNNNNSVHTLLKPNSQQLQENITMMKMRASLPTPAAPQSIIPPIFIPQQKQKQQEEKKKEKSLNEKVNKEEDITKLTLQEEEKEKLPLPVQPTLPIGSDDDDDDDDMPDIDMED